jgi:hypothetical protein
MTHGSFASIIAAGGSWTGAVVLFTTNAPLIACASSTEIGQVLFALAEGACAACVDANQAMGATAAAAGSIAAALAAAAAAGVTGEELEWYNDDLERWRDSVLDWREDRRNRPRSLPIPPQEKRPIKLLRSDVRHRINRVSRQLQKWAEYWVGKDESGTVPGGGKA